MNEIWTPEEEASRLSARFAQIKELWGMGQAKFARTFNVPGGASMVSQHIKGRRPLSLEAAGAYAKGFGCDLIEISPRLAKEVMDATANSRSPDMFSPNHNGKVPLISWGQARKFHDSGSLPSSAAIDWLACPVIHSARCYCLIAQGDGMDDGGPDGYREGDILFVETQAGPEMGDDVLVNTGPSMLALRRLKQDSEGAYLLTLNGRKIERISDDFQFSGVVIFSGRKRAKGWAAYSASQKTDSKA